MAADELVRPAALARIGIEPGFLPTGASRVLREQLEGRVLSMLPACLSGSAPSAQRSLQNSRRLRNSTPGGDAGDDRLGARGNERAWAIP